MRSKKIPYFIMFMAMVLLPFSGFSQDPPQPAKASEGAPPPPPGLPIDSNLPYLLIAGLGLGIYYLRPKKAA